MPVFPGDSPSFVLNAARRLAAGELVAFPTETVYGLGARADDDAAVSRIYAAKGRPSDHPLIVHVASVDAARDFASSWPATAQRLTQAFWPGPLTVIVPRRPGIAEAAAAGQPTIGLRCPAHPVALRLLAAAAGLGVPGVAAPSANRFGRISPTRAAHVVDEFGDALTVLDGGHCEVGIESAIVDCSRDGAVLLRPGVLGRGRLEALLGGPLRARDAAAPRAPGMLASHYAPSARVRLMTAQELQAALASTAVAGRAVAIDPEPAGAVAVYSRSVRSTNPAVLCRMMPADAASAAHELFAALRELDALGVAQIWIEAPPDDPAWDGVRDRLQRAAAA